MYKFQTGRGPDNRGTEGAKTLVPRSRCQRRQGGRECVPLPSRLEGLGEHRKLPQRVWGGALAENEFWCILELEKKPLNRHKYGEYG